MQIKDKTDSIDCVKKFIQSIAGDYRIYSVYLFGSRLYGVPDETSDIDIAIVLDETVDYAKELAIFKKAQRFNLDLEPVVYSVSEFESDAADLIVEIKHKGKKIA